MINLRKVVLVFSCLYDSYRETNLPMALSNKALVQKDVRDIK